MHRLLTRLTLQGRLGLVLNVLLLIFALILTSLVVLNARSSVREEMEAASKVAQHLLRFVIESESPDGRPPDAQRMVGMLNRLGRIRAHEVVLYAGDASVLYQSPGATYKAGREAPAWFGRLIAPPVAELRVSVGPMTLAAHSNSSRAVLDAWDDTRVVLAVIAALLLLLNVVVRRLVRRSLAGLQQVAVAMSAMEAGQLTARLPPLDPPELAELGLAFNRMAAALEASQQQNRQLSADQAVARLVQQRLDEERLAIARELHDELGQCVTAVRAIAMSIAHRTEHSLPEVHGGALSIVTVAGSLYDAVHAIVARLRPAALARLGLADGLREWLSAWQAAHPGRELAFTACGDLGGVSARLEVAAFRIVQEALSNAVRHGSARHLQVQIESVASGLLVAIEDDGCGFASDENPPRGFGLLGMEERARELGGRLQIDSRPGVGTRVQASFPREKEEQ